MAQARYDAIGEGYSRRRRADPRIAARIEAALGDARRVLNVGATGPTGAQAFASCAASRDAWCSSPSTSRPRTSG
jgi:hypothetical protein